MEKKLQYIAEINAIPMIRKDLNELARLWNIPGSELKQITLITEELFSNTIRYAFGDDAEHLIEIEFSKAGNLLTLEIIDDGLPFNPMDYNHVHGSDPAAADDGGMGLTLIKTFSDSIEYSRKNNKNHLLILKTIRSHLT